MALHLPKYKKVTMEHAVSKYHRPKYVYIPLISGGDTNVTLLVQKGDYVNKGEPVARRKGASKIPILASVSGTVIGFEEHLCYKNEMVKCVKIENDFKEAELNVKKNTRLTDITKKEFVELLKEKGIVGLGGAEFPTYVKYESKNKINTLIVNAIECEPYVSTDQVLGINYADEILEAVDAILTINEIEEAYIAVDKTNTKLISELTNHLGTYLKIKLYIADNIYPMGWEKMLVSKITGEDYDEFPSEIGVVVNNIATINAIYIALKYNRGLTERIVTFAGDMLKNPQNISVKNGTLISEVIESIEGYKRAKDIMIIAGGPMMGEAIKSDDLVVSPGLNAVLVLKSRDEEDYSPCIRCGKCVETCPLKLSPVIIKDNLKNPEALKKLNVQKCIECGACSFICPSGLKVREWVKLAKEKIKEVK